MKPEIAKLQEKMTALGIDAFYIPCGDPHNSEYFPAYYQCAEFFSGLHAEAQELVITKDSAYLWTDGRYFLQADRELAGSGIELMRIGHSGFPTIPEFLKNLVGSAPSAFTLAYDGSIVCAAESDSIAKSIAGDDSADDSAEDADVSSEAQSAASEKAVRIITDIDPTDEIWEDRPPITPTKIWKLPLSSCGRTAEEKVSDIRAAMAQEGADILLISDLMENAWTFNLRGNDIDYTPVFMSYTLITKDSCELFVMDESFISEHAAEPGGLGFVKVRGYEEITDALREFFGESSDSPVIWYDPENVSTSVATAVPADARKILKPTPISDMKSVKNGTEIACTLNAHKKDGAAMVKFLFWLKNRLAGISSASSDNPLTEIEAANYLLGCRESMEGFLDLSFETISAYGPNGAIIHYEPTKETNAEILPEGFLLVDSGAHYINGTTDITRTIACGPLTDEMKKCYTLVLKSHIALALARIPEGTMDADLDSMARKPLRDAGYDFDHGISHGVGHILSVHEGPNGIRLRRNASDLCIKPGCIQSDEPGIYLAGKFGVRIENEILCVGNEAAGIGSVGLDPAAGTTTEGSAIASIGGSTIASIDGSTIAGKDRPFSFKTITFCPYEREAILTDLLTSEEKTWLNDYNQMVRRELLPLLSEDERAFLFSQTAF